MIMSCLWPNPSTLPQLVKPADAGLRQVRRVNRFRTGKLTFHSQSERDAIDHVKIIDGIPSTTWAPSAAILESGQKPRKTTRMLQIFIAVCGL